MTGLETALATAWSQLVSATSQFIIPDWGAVIGLLPVLLLIGVVGPALTLLVLAWVVSTLRSPRAGVRLDEGPTLAPVGSDGRPAFPPGLPHCTRDRLVFASGTTRCTECRNDLSVICPMCGLARTAGVTTCGNCGLVLRVQNRARVMRPTGPPQGGAAAA